MVEWYIEENRWTLKWNPLRFFFVHRKSRTNCPIILSTQQTKYLTVSKWLWTSKRTVVLTFAVPCWIGLHVRKSINTSPCFSSKKTGLMGLWHKQLLGGRSKPHADGYKGITICWNYDASYTLTSILNFDSCFFNSVSGVPFLCPASSRARQL
jgi:hypothetical protein